LFNIVIEFIRYAAERKQLSKDFFFNDSTLVVNVIEKGRVAGDRILRKEIEETIDAIVSFDPRMKAVF
jgi:hypothetical protein